MGGNAVKNRRRELPIFADIWVPYTLIIYSGAGEACCFWIAHVAFHSLVFCMFLEKWDVRYPNKSVFALSEAPLFIFRCLFYTILKIIASRRATKQLISAHPLGIIFHKGVIVLYTSCLYKGSTFSMTESILSMTKNALKLVDCPSHLMTRTISLSSVDIINK